MTLVSMTLVSVTLARLSLACGVVVASVTAGFAACPPDDLKCLEDLLKAGKKASSAAGGGKTRSLSIDRGSGGPVPAGSVATPPPPRPQPGGIVVKATAARPHSAEADAALTPVREYLRAAEIPPPGVGAYGLVVFQSKATPANRDKLTMVCRSFVAFFPRGADTDVPIGDRMITVWPVDDPASPRAAADDCDFVIDHYELSAAEAAIRDAHRQQPEATFQGEGPYLVGWSPSSTRGVPDKLVLVIDMSADNSQASIDHKFLFWKSQIVLDPAKWRSGFSLDRIRVAIHDFADQYGQSMLDAIKLVGGK